VASPKKDSKTAPPAKQNRNTNPRKRRRTKNKPQKQGAGLGQGGIVKGRPIKSQRYGEKKAPNKRPTLKKQISALTHTKEHKKQRGLAAIPMGAKRLKQPCKSQQKTKKNKARPNPRPTAADQGEYTKQSPEKKKRL